MPRTPRIQILTRLDDIGRTATTNTTAVRLLSSGSIGNLSLLVVGPASTDALEKLQGHEVCLGLHFAITCGKIGARLRPILPPEEVPSLVDENGIFLNTAHDLHDHGVDIDEALAELQAQWDFVQKSGLPIRYVDDHMAVSWLGEGQLGREIRKFCQAHDVMFAPTAPVTVENFELYLPFPPQYRSLLGQLSVSEVDDFVRNLMNGTWLWSIHPAYDPEEVEDFRRRHPRGRPEEAFGREQLRRIFEGPVVQRFLRHPQVQVLRYDELADSSCSAIR